MPDLERGPVLACGPEPMTTAMRVRRQYDDSNADCECIAFKESQTDHDRIAPRARTTGSQVWAKRERTDHGTTVSNLPPARRGSLSCRPGYRRRGHRTPPRAFEQRPLPARRWRRRSLCYYRVPPHIRDRRAARYGSFGIATRTLPQRFGLQPGRVRGVEAGFAFSPNGFLQLPPSTLDT